MHCRYLSVEHGFLTTRYYCQKVALDFDLKHDQTRITKDQYWAQCQGRLCRRCPHYLR